MFVFYFFLFASSNSPCRSLSTSFLGGENRAVSRTSALTLGGKEGANALVQIPKERSQRRSTEERW